MMFLSKISGQRADWKRSAIIVLSCFLLPGFLRAQAPPPAPLPATSESAPPRLPPEALNQLLAPIALYPDALIALILPASTVPSDVVLAARFISSSGDPAQVANQPWDDSVKSLVRYPDVVKWMDQNLEWTTQVGEAFLDQPADVMNTIQQLRAQAIAAGNLVDTPQQRIVKEESCVRIVPAEPEVIYVPRYDPEVVYVQPYEPYLGPALTFGVGFAVGSWLNYDCDWPGRRVCVGDWNPGWRNDWNPGWRNDWNPGWRNDWNPGWRNDWDPRWKHKWKGNRGGDTINVVTINGDTARIWQPSAKVQRKQWQRERNYNNNATAYYNVNARGRRGDRNDQGRRFAAVARPSRLDFNGRAGDGDRPWRRSNSDESNLARNLPGEVRDPRTFRGQPPGQSDQLSRGDGNREWKGKGRGKEGYQSNAMVKQESPSVKEKGWQANNSQARKWRAESSSIKTGSSRPSANGDQSRSYRSKSLHSNANDSSQRFKTGRSKASHSQGTTPSYSKANKHSQSARVERSKGGSQTSGASYSKANKHSQSARVERSRGGSQNSGASYSTPNKSQSAGATGKGSGGGGHKSGKKGSSNKGDKGKG